METEKRRIEEETRRKVEKVRKREEEAMRKETERRKLEEEERRKTEEVIPKREEERKNKEKEQQSLLDIKKKKLQDDMRIRKEGDSLRKEEERKVETDREQKEEVFKMDKSKNKQEMIQVTKTEEEHLGQGRKAAEDQWKREEQERKEMIRGRMENERKKQREEGREIDEEKLRKHEDGEEKRRVKEEDRRKREEPRNKIDFKKVKVEDEVGMMTEREEMQKKMEPERIKKDDDERTRSVDVTETENKEQKSEDGMMLKTEEEVRRMIALKNNQAERNKDKKENKKQDKDMISQNWKKREDERRAEMEKRVKQDKEESIKSHLVEDVEKKEDDKRNTREEDQTKGRNACDSKEDEKMTIRMDDEPSSEQGYRVQYKDDKRRFKSSDKAKRKEELEGKIKSKKKNLNEAKMEKDQMEDGADGRENGEQNEEEVGGNVKEVEKETGEEIRVKEKDKYAKIVHYTGIGNKRKETQCHSINEKNHRDGAENVITKSSAAFSTPAPSHRNSTVSSICTETAPQQYDQDKITTPTSMYKTTDCKGPFSASESFPVLLPEHTEQKRLSWMKECVPWSKLSLLNKRKQRGSSRSGRGTRRAAETCGLPPLCPDALLKSTGWPSLEEVTTVTLEDLPGCSLSTLSQCPQLQSLTLRRCGLKSLEGINHLQQLCSIDVQENDISFISCENMRSLRVLKLSYNKLTSIHGLTGTENLDVLELSNNSITRIAGLESLKTLQRLSLDHNQLIGTKGLKDVYTLLHLNCSHNHLVKVEGLENNVLLNTLDLRANSLTEPPSLNNHVLLRELLLDDNSISSLQSLAARWLPLMQHLSAAQNRITQLPPMPDFVSLQSLDLRFNCLSDLQNVNESLEGCQFLQVLHLKGNPLQQESGWRSSLQRALPGLRFIDDQETDSSPAVVRFSLTFGSFFTFCQAQLSQTHDLHEQHCRELSQAPSPLVAIKTSCQHFTEALQLAEDQRFAHEYGDTSVADNHDPADRTAHEETPDDGAEEHTKQTEMHFIEKTVSVTSKRDILHCSYWTVEERPPLVDGHDTVSTVSAGLKTEQTACEVKSGRVKSSATKGNKSLSKCVMDSVTINQDLNLQNRAAVVIQQMWRKYWQKCGNIGGMSTAERGGDGGGDEGGGGGTPESGPSLNNRDVLGRESAATVIQAVWRGFTLRRRLTSALAAVTCPDIGEDDTFEEVDVDEFVFDEAALEEQWTPFCEDQPPRCYSEAEQLLPLKPPGAFTEPTQKHSPHPLVWRSKQAWVDEEQEVSAAQRVLSVNSSRGKSPAPAAVLSGLSERSEQILEEWGFTNSHTAFLMLKRAQKMKSKKQQQKKNPSTHLALFKTCSYHKDPAEAQKGPMKHDRNKIKVTESKLGLQQTPRTEGTRQDRAQQWPHARAAHVDNDSESLHFLPEISTDILHGGRVQLVADLGYSERQHHANGSWANSSLAARPCRENRHLHRNSSGQTRKEASSPKRVSSTPSKKERISFRDNPVRLSGGWGGGKKRDRDNK